MQHQVMFAIENKIEVAKMLTKKCVKVLNNAQSLALFTTCLNIF
jgi:hypothetical protein